jgi:predicted phosphodiesterase
MINFYLIKNNLLYLIRTHKIIFLSLIAIILLTIGLIIIKINSVSDNKGTLVATPVEKPSPKPSPSVSPPASKTATSNTKRKISSQDTSSNESSDEPASSDDEGSTEDEPGSGSNPSDGDASTPTPPSDPPEESPSAFVAFYSDNQSDTDAEDARHQKVVDRIMSSGANPVFHGGDLMEDGTQNSLDRFNAVAGSLVASKNFYGALGNNDRKIGDSSTPSPLYLANFSFPGNERWYSVNYGNLHMVILDSSFASLSADQLSWLESDLQSAASRDRITGVIFHHPSFASTIQSYLNNNAVDFVIDGHTHSYVKTTSNGIYYFTLPGGGSLGYALASIYSNQAKLYFYNENGALLGSQAVANR